MKETMDICLDCRTDLVFADYVCEDTGKEGRGKCDVCHKKRYVFTCEVYQRPVNKDGET